MKKYLLVLIVFVMILSCFFGKTLVMASEEDSSSSRDRYYTEIRIEKGDTLWSIAQTYNRNSGMEIREYIRELKEINQMISDDIAAGDYLTVVYFPETVPGKK